MISLHVPTKPNGVLAQHFMGFADLLVLHMFFVLTRAWCPYTCPLNLLVSVLKPLVSLHVPGKLIGVRTRAR